MGLVGFHRDAACPRHHLALIKDQRDGAGDGDAHHDQRLEAVVDGFGRQDAAHALNHQEQSRGADEGPLRQTCQRLGLAMAEAVFGVGGCQRRADGDEIEPGGEKIQRRIRQARQHRHRMRGEIGVGLYRHQEQRYRHRSDSGALHQRCGLFQLAHGNSLSVRQASPGASRS